MPKVDKAPYRVLLFNDDQTPMEFVVVVLQNFFHMEKQAAIDLMLKVHNEGSAVCGTYPHHEAKLLVAEVLGLASGHRHPLRCAMEAAN